MRVAVVHSYYSRRQPSGENVVVDLQLRALRRAGHDVRLFAVRQDDVEEHRGYPVRAAYTAATGRGPHPGRAIEAWAPDIVHVHNLFPNMGRTWVHRFSDRLVTTLHNFRPICPAGTLQREGHACTLCPHAGHARAAVRYGCYRDSRLMTVPVALGTRFAGDPVVAGAARVMVLSESMREQYAAAGVAPGRMAVVPNFVEADEYPEADPGDHWIYAGRLVPEKGVLPLVRDWPHEAPVLKVVGDGPLAGELRRIAGPNVELLGQRSHEETRRLLSAAVGLLFTSTWLEGLPLVYLEALSSGTPVLATSASVVGQLVAASGTGIVSDRIGLDLPRAARLFPTLRAHCREVFTRTYTEAAWLAATTAIYRDVRGWR